jgi:phosphatidylglycerophosphatase A
MNSPWSRPADRAADRDGDHAGERHPAAVEDARVLRETPWPGARAASAAGPALPPSRPSAAFMRRHPAHWIALGFGSGLAPRAPGTVGTLWAWVSFLMLDDWVVGLAGPAGWGLVLVAGTLLGIWACTRTAQHLGTADPGAIVWDEVLGFWLVLWLLTPASWWAQLGAFVLFRIFDAVKRGPVGWADRRYKLQSGQAIGWLQGWGVIFDDLVAAGMTLLVIALGLRLWSAA